MVSFLSLYKNTQINNVLEDIFILAHSFRGVQYVIGWLGISWSMVRQNMAARTPCHDMLLTIKAGEGEAPTSPLHEHSVEDIKFSPGFHVLTPPNIFSS